MTVQDETGGLQVALLRMVPDNFALERSTPNPARGQATIRYRIPKQVPVQITLYDILGRKVTTLVEGEKKAGTHSVRVDVRSLPSGRYFYRMSAGNFSRVQRMSVLQ
jgi:phosphodiesterase/alkaline phosphatase D-like protein